MLVQDQGYCGRTGQALWYSLLSSPHRASCRVRAPTRARLFFAEHRSIRSMVKLRVTLPARADDQRSHRDTPSAGSRPAAQFFARSRSATMPPCPVRCGKSRRRVRARRRGALVCASCCPTLSIVRSTTSHREPACGFSSWRPDCVADDAVSCEPVSAPNSLLTGKLTGNFAQSGPPRRFRRPVSQ
jgi:hypothetical protein